MGRECESSNAVAYLSLTEKLMGLFQLAAERCQIMAYDVDASEDSILREREGHFSDVTHAVSIERVGPSVLDGRPRSMRGIDVSHLHAPLHALWDYFRSRGRIAGSVGRKVHCIAIGDGGNEIGMGNVSSLVAKHVKLGDEIACRCTCDFLICAGISNWGGLALFILLASSLDLCEPLLVDANIESFLIMECMRVGTVDGVLASSSSQSSEACGEERPAPSVDGFPTDSEVHEVTRTELLRLKRALMPM
jgi:hypothetical protein